MTRQNNASYEGQGQRKIRQITALDIYPVGAIYLSINPENPSDIFGGTWELLAPGRTLVCVDTEQEKFDQAGKMGGRKTNKYSHTDATQDHVLTINEIPSHNHDFYNALLAVSQNEITGGFDTVATNYGFQNTLGSWFSGWSKGTNAASRYTGKGWGHNHGNVTDTAQDISTLQPYFTCYMWIRTN